MKLRRQLSLAREAGDDAKEDEILGDMDDAWYEMNTAEQARLVDAISADRRATRSAKA
jgi:hypothetical protein